MPVIVYTGGHAAVEVDAFGLRFDRDVPAEVSDEVAAALVLEGSEYEYVTDAGTPAPTEEN